MVGGPSKQGDEIVTAELEWSEAGVVEEGKMATYIVRKPGGGKWVVSPPSPALPQESEQETRSTFVFGLRQFTTNCIRASVLADTTRRGVLRNRV